MPAPIVVITGARPPRPNPCVCTFCSTLYASPLPTCTSPLCEARCCPEHRDVEGVCDECILEPGWLRARADELFGSARA